VVVEAAFTYGVMNQLSDCDDLKPDQDSGPIATALMGPLMGWLCRHRVGLHVQRTRAEMDNRWLPLLHTLQAGVPAAISDMKRLQDAVRDDSVWALLRWRNTFGHLLFSIADANSVYLPYLARQADLELQHELVSLLVQAQALGVPAAERMAWFEQRAQSPYARGRLTWPSGSLVARTWQAEFAPAATSDPRATVRLDWPSQP
jgi:hypothetical protein